MQSTASAQRQLLACLHVGDTQTAPGSASNGKRHVPHPTLKHCCSVPICLSKALSLWHLIPVGPLECSAELAPWSAGSWSLLEWSVGDSAASTGPARNPKELLWVLWSLLG